MCLPTWGIMMQYSTARSDAINALDLSSVGGGGVSGCTGGGGGREKNVKAPSRQIVFA
jgi:hypothetical protein